MKNVIVFVKEKKEEDSQMPMKSGLTTFPGGLPLKDKNGNIIGAIGVSGSSVEDDHEVALAGAAALKK